MSSLSSKSTRTPIKKRRSKPRRGPMRDAKYRKWIIETQRCEMSYLGGCVYPIDLAHTRNNGMRSKGPDSSCVPLCRRHHQEYDTNRRLFEEKYSVNLEAAAAKHYAEYLAQSSSTKR